MLHFSKTAGYAVHALSCIGAGQPESSLIRDVAKCTGLKKPYLAKIINQLVHRGLVKAKRGYRGGLMLGRPPESITMLEVVKTVESDAPVSGCIFGLQGCCPAGGRCPAHDLWTAMAQKLEYALANISLRDVMDRTPPRPKRRPRPESNAGRPRLEDRLPGRRRRESQSVG